MQPFPHQYIAAATAAPEGEVSLSSEGIVSLPSAPPVPFGGPGDRWSPETLLTAAVADCFILTFRAISAASKLAWTDIRVQSTGTLDTVDRVPQFTAFALQVARARRHQRGAGDAVAREDGEGVPGGAVAEGDAPGHGLGDGGLVP